MIFETSPTQLTKMIPTYDFTGDAITILGLVGIVSTAVIVFTAFRRFRTSPYRK